jgi:hypothetical protein
MTWQDYEEQVFNELTRAFPNANIQHDIRLPGRFSKTERQVDIHIGGIAAGVYYQIIVDTKFYSKRIDTKDIEEFIGMLGDLDCNHGILITEKGFPRGAVSRAANNPFSVSVDIISFSELKEYQTSGGAIPYTDKFALLIRPPLGWAIDMRSEPHAYMVSLYNRSYSTREEAIAAEDFMYVTIEPKQTFPTLRDLLQSQEAESKKRLPSGTTFQYSRWRSTNERQYDIRSIYIPGRQAIEITAFAQFRSFFCSCVLLTPLNNVKVNFPRLIYVMDGLFGMERQDGNAEPLKEKPN